MNIYIHKHMHSTLQRGVRIDIPHVFTQIYTPHMKTYHTGIHIQSIIFGHIHYTPYTRIHTEMPYIHTIETHIYRHIHT